MIDLSIPLWGKVAIGVSWLTGVAVSTADGADFFESALNSAPELVVLVVLVYVFVRAAQAKDRLFADASKANAVASKEVAEALGRVSGVLEVLDLRSKR